MIADLLDGFACLLLMLFVAASLIGLHGYLDEGKPRNATAAWFIGLVIVSFVVFWAVIT